MNDTPGLHLNIDQRTSTIERSRATVKLTDGSEIERASIVIHPNGYVSIGEVDTSFVRRSHEKRKHKQHEGRLYPPNKIEYID